MAKKATKKQETTPVVSPAHQKTLHKWHTGFGLLLVLQAGLIVALGGKASEAITLRYLSIDQLATQADKHQVLATATRHLFDARLSWVIAAFLLLFAAVHLVAASSYESKYIEGLRRGVSKVRWIAFGIGGGALVATVGLLSGFNDVVTIGLLWASVIVAAICALAVDLLGPGRTGLHRLLGVVAGVGFVLPWLALVSSLLGAAAYGGHVPGYLWFVYATFALFSAAAVMATCFRWKLRGKWANVVYTEKMFMILGLVATSLLAWQMFNGTR